MSLDGMFGGLGAGFGGKYIFLRCLEVLSSVSVPYFADAGLACRHLSGGKPMYRGLEACCL